MIRAVLLLLCLASPALGQGFAPFEGEWQGEGTLSLPDEPAQRFRCRLRLEGTLLSGHVMQGRCATAQGGQNFTYLLRETGDGRVRGENREPVADDRPALLDGRIEGGVLRLEDGAGTGLFEMRRQGNSLLFRLQGRGRQGPVQGEAVLQLRD